jgi:cobalt-zinc-cadmium efflux system protein
MSALAPHDARGAPWTTLGWMAHAHEDLRHPGEPGAHGHAHTHGHHHEHSHVDADGRAFFIGVVLNSVIVVVEAVYGVLGHSVALLADAGHNLGDVLGLVLAGGSTFLAQLRPTKRRTYGYRRLTLFSALANGVFLLVATGAIAWESIRRLSAPEPVATTPVIVVAAIAVVINSASALLFFRGSQHDLNVRAAFLHLAGDAGISAAVIVATVVMAKTGWLLLDPILSLAVGGLILVSTWSLLGRSVNMVLDAVPDGIDIDAVRGYLASLPRVREVHDLHVWAMSTTETALTAHLVMPSEGCEPTFLSGVCSQLHDRFGIEHSTLQVDPENAPEPCRLAPEDAV